MKASIVSTTRVIEINGVPARVWEGETDTGVKFYAAITRVAVHKNEDTSQFQKELEEHKTPVARAIDAFDLRTVI